MTDVSSALWQAWLLYWASAAFIGAFFGTLAALAARAISKFIVRMIKKLIG